jgi:hypothetical protein
MNRQIPGIAGAIAAACALARIVATGTPAARAEVGRGALPVEGKSSGFDGATPG